LLSWKNIVLFHPPTAASHCRDPLSDAATRKSFISTTTAAAAATATTATLAATVTRPRRLACNLICWKKTALFLPPTAAHHYCDPPSVHATRQKPASMWTPAAATAIAPATVTTVATTMSTRSFASKRNISFLRPSTNKSSALTARKHRNLLRSRAMRREHTSNTTTTTTAAAIPIAQVPATTPVTPMPGTSAPLAARALARQAVAPALGMSEPLAAPVPVSTMAAPVLCAWAPLMAPGTQATMIKAVYVSHLFTKAMTNTLSLRNQMLVSMPPRQFPAVVAVLTARAAADQTMTTILTLRIQAVPSPPPTIATAAVTEMKISGASSTSLETFSMNGLIAKTLWVKSSVRLRIRDTFCSHILRPKSGSTASMGGRSWSLQKILTMAFFYLKLIFRQQAPKMHQRARGPTPRVRTHHRRPLPGSVLGPHPQAAFGPPPQPALGPPPQPGLGPPLHPALGPPPQPAHGPPPQPAHGPPPQPAPALL
ncbi:hypothetical protein DFQ26_006517, partial [Actinomortierella ambigua]